jgi:hypothetical protein
MWGNRTIVALMLALLLIVPISSCAGYGVLLHTQMVEPPTVNVKIGPAHLIGGTFPLLCQRAPYCARAHERPRTYRASLFVHIGDTYAIQLVRIILPLPPAAPTL